MEPELRKPLRVGVVGAGAIGAVLCRALDRGELAARLVRLWEVDATRREALLATLSTPPPALDLARLGEVAELLVEAAGAAVAPLVVEAALAAGRDVLVMSVGGLLGR